MNTVKCPGCLQNFNHGISIKTHQRSCTALRLAGQQQIKKRVKNAQKREAVKLARIEGQSMDDIVEERRELREDFEDTHVAQEPAAAPSPSREHLAGPSVVSIIIVLLSQGPDSTEQLPSDPIPGSSGRPARTIRLPKRYRDELPPAPPIPIPDPDPDIEETISEHVVEKEERAVETPNVYRTDPDSYGVVREYFHGEPSITPDTHYSLSEISDSPYLATDGPSHLKADPPTFLSPLQKICLSATSAVQTVFAPFRNISIYRLMTWFYSSSNTKSVAELNSLVKNVLLAPDFQPEDLFGFDAKKEHAVMDSYQESPVEGPSPFAFDDTWIKGSVAIPLPCDGVKQSEEQAPKFVIEVYYRKLMDVIKAALSEPAAEKFHTFPFKEFWKPGPNEPEERIYSESYTGDRWNEEYAKIHAANQEGPHHHLEAFIVALMIWSDSTMLAQFGNAALWPIYLFIGNQSKYSRAKPSSFAAHHVAYMPKVCFHF